MREGAEMAASVISPCGDQGPMRSRDAQTPSPHPKNTKQSTPIGQPMCLCFLRNSHVFPKLDHAHALDLHAARCILALP
jgi:hypothetical protein